MVDAVLAWLRTDGGPLVYAVLALASALEYVFPPFPGDTVVLFGVFLAVTAGLSPPLVYAALTAGSIGGAMLAWRVGRAIARDPERPPRFLRSRAARATLAEVQARFRRHGATYLALNRFLPALRALFFVGAGVAGLPASRVALWGGLSAAAWNALLFAAGWGLGAQWRRLEALARTYTTGAFGVAAVVLVVFAALVVRRLRRGTAPPALGDDERAPSGRRAPQEAGSAEATLTVPPSPTSPPENARPGETPR
jgi:membrane-associated protein